MIKNKVAPQTAVTPPADETKIEADLSEVSEVAEKPETSDEVVKVPHIVPSSSSKQPTLVHDAFERKAAEMQAELDAMNEADVPKWTSSRFALAVVGSFGFLNLYALRVNLSIALVCMVNRTTHTSMTNTTTRSLVLPSFLLSDSCSDIKANEGNTEGEFLWDKGTQGLILGCFFYGYLLTQIPGGWLAHKYSGKYVFGFAVLVASLATIATPLASRISASFLMVLQVVIGFSLGFVFPAMHSIWSRWAPPLERSKLIGFTYSGAQLGSVVALPISGQLCKLRIDNGWPFIFYVFGAAGLIWFVVWMIVVADSPAEHPRISPIERKFIELSIGPQPAVKQKRIPWGKFFSSGPVWAIIIGHTCANFGTYALLTNMPSYMKEVLKFDIQSNGLFSAIPYIMFWICINVAGICTDHFIMRGWSVRLVRNVSTSIGMLFPALFLVITGLMTCEQPYWAVAFLTVALGSSGFQFAGVLVNHVDIAPQYAGLLFGLSNTAATIPGIVAPTVISLVTPDGTREQWLYAFLLCAAVYVFGWFIYLILADGVVQPWAAYTRPTPVNVISTRDVTNPAAIVFSEKKVQQSAEDGTSPGGGRLVGIPRHMRFVSLASALTFGHAVHE